MTAYELTDLQRDVLRDIAAVINDDPELAEQILKLAGPPGLTLRDTPGAAWAAGTHGHLELADTLGIVGAVSASIDQAQMSALKGLFEIAPDVVKTGDGLVDAAPILRRFSIWLAEHAHHLAEKAPELWAAMEHYWQS